MLLLLIPNRLGLEFLFILCARCCLCCSLLSRPQATEVDVDGVSAMLELQDDDAERDEAADDDDEGGGAAGYGE